MAMELTPEACALPPTAIDSALTALESAAVELAWKYLTPLLVMLVISVCKPNSCEPFTASVLVALISPAAT
ncbi:hypothetical protein D3C71_2102210 [compost metagenome]